MPEFTASVFTRAPGSAPDDSVLIDVLADALDATGESARWEQATDGFWCSLTPSEGSSRTQGWKLHLSATLASAETVLARALPVLLTERSAFKFASTTARVAQLNSRSTPRGQSGKFLTVYPRSDADAVRLAEALHQATVGLAGPRILSDRPYAPDSLVHYRYGAFVEQRTLSNDGLYSWVILDPDGNPVEDSRVGRYLPPSWATCPFPGPEPSTPAGSTAGDARVLVGDRFLVREAIRHANKGGVYRATDTQTQEDVVIKEARPHVDSDASGRDVQDLLRAEARALDAIGPLGIAPRSLGLFEQSTHLFLAEELVPGVALRQWVLDRIRAGGWRRDIPEAREMATRLVKLMAAAHRGGVILRDFNPNNIMVRPDGALRLIDLELAAVIGDDDGELTRAGTPGYVAPEQMTGTRPAVEADYYSLGATICFVITGSTPSLLAEEPELRPWRERLAEWLAVRDGGPGGSDVHALILGLMEAAPEHRLTTAEVATMLASSTRRQTERDLHGHAGAPDLARLDDEQWRDAVDGMLNYLLTTMDPSDDERLWPASCAHGSPDPCVVQLGAAGVIGVLTRCLELTGDERLPAAIATAGDWVIRRLGADAKRPPGLHFGEAGIAWSLYEAGRSLGDDRLTEHGLELASALPVSWDTPDITHGTAGIGLTFLHLWMRTGNAEFAARAGESADALLACVEAGTDGLIWGTPAAFDSRLAGGRYYGFAHGTAGVGYFLLSSALATGRTDCMELASQAGETLLDTAIVADGAAQWGAGPGNEATAPYWCHGSAGIGGFLTRLHRASGDDRFGKLAQMSAQAVMENSWRGVLGQCHGLAGNGEFLLDLAETGDRQRYEALAHRLARVILASRACREGNVVFPDESGGLSASWADGVSGILAFLLRLGYSSPRLWTLDALLERGNPA
ncbi:MAG: class IV lanthionine synthetase LanL [Pseudonocardia sp.]